MSKISKKGETAKPQFDPQKNYRWQPDDVFELSGIDFSTVFNTLKEAALSPNGTSALSIVASYNLMNALLIRGVEEGVIVEVVPPPLENKPAGIPELPAPSPNGVAKKAKKVKDTPPAE